MGSGGRCRSGGDTKPNGNCTNPGPDDLVVQCVGVWAKEKHDYVRRYVEATRAARLKYLPPRGKGGAAFIDLFAGPGSARVGSSGEIIEGSTDRWKSHVTRPQDAVKLIMVLYEQLARFGYTQGHVRTAEIKTKGRVLYHLVFATKAPLGDKIWQSVVRTDVHGQRSFPGMDQAG